MMAPCFTASTPPQSRPATPQLTHHRVGPGRIGRSVTTKGPGQAMPTSLLQRHGYFFRLRVDVVVMAVHARQRTPSGISDSFSNALSPRLGLFVNVVVDAMSVVP